MSSKSLPISNPSSIASLLVLCVCACDLKIVGFSFSSHHIYDICNRTRQQQYYHVLHIPYVPQSSTKHNLLPTYLLTYLHFITCLCACCCCALLLALGCYRYLGRLDDLCHLLLLLWLLVYLLCICCCLAPVHSSVQLLAVALCIEGGLISRSS